MTIQQGYIEQKHGQRTVRKPNDGSGNLYI